MTDIVERLRHVASVWEPDEKSSIQLEAAAEIERLRTQLELAESDVIRLIHDLYESNYCLASTVISPEKIKFPPHEDAAAAIRVLFPTADGGKE